MHDDLLCMFKELLIIAGVRNDDRGYRGCEKGGSAEPQNEHDNLQTEDGARDGTIPSLETSHHEPDYDVDQSGKPNDETKYDGLIEGR